MTGLDVQELTLAAGALLALGWISVLGVAAIPATRATGRDLLRAISGTTIVIALLFGSFWAGQPVLGVALGALALRVGYEVGSVRFGPAFALAVAALTLGFAAFAVAYPWVPVALGVLWAVALCLRLLTPFTPAAFEVAIYPILPMAILAGLASDPKLATLLLLAFILTETFDSYAYTFGKLFGHKLAFPRLSPRKTLAGLWGGGVCVALTAAIVAIVLGLSPLLAAALAALAAALGLAGDLAASHHKRAAGVKDYPTVLPGQGGAFDVFDAWIAAGAGLALLAHVVT